MLIKCPECNKEISDSAPSCPQCGYILNASIHNPLSSEVPLNQHKKTAIFQFISIGAIFVALSTPRILISLPCLVIITTGIIALFRKEPRWLLSVICIILGFFFISAAVPNFNGDTSYISKMEMQEWNWEDQSNYSYVRGRVKNNGDKTVSYFQITAFYKDSSGNVIDTDFTNSAESLLPGMAKEFEIMHKSSPEYSKVSISVEKVRTE